MKLEAEKRAERLMEEARKRGKRSDGICTSSAGNFKLYGKEQ